MTVPEVVTLATFARGEPSPLHDLARAFHAGDQAAADGVATLAMAWLVGDGARLLPLTAPGEAIAAIAVPGHLAGSANRPVEDLLARLALAIPGLAAVQGGLVRVADAPRGRDQDRPRDPAAEAATLHWHEDRLAAPAARILLVDDVIRTGVTLEAALRAAPPGLRDRIVPLAVFRAEE